MMISQKCWLMEFLFCKTDFIKGDFSAISLARISSNDLAPIRLMTSTITWSIKTSVPMILRLYQIFLVFIRCCSQLSLCTEFFKHQKANENDVGNWLSYLVLQVTSQKIVLNFCASKLKSLIY